MQALSLFGKEQGWPSLLETTSTYVYLAREITRAVQGILKRGFLCQAGYHLLICQNSLDLLSIDILILIWVLLQHCMRQEEVLRGEWGM